MATETEKPSMSTIAQTVRQRRTQLDLSQAKAAQQAGISRRAWSEIELGQRRGSAETLAKIDLVLKLPSGSLIALEEKPVVDELAEIRRELIEMVGLLTTREELEQARLDLTRTRFNALRAQLERYERERSGRDETTGGRQRER